MFIIIYWVTEATTHEDDWTTYGITIKSSLCVSYLITDTYDISISKGPPYEQPNVTSIVHNSSCTTPIDMILSVLERGEWDLSIKGSISLK